MAPARSAFLLPSAFCFLPFGDGARALLSLHVMARRVGALFAIAILVALVLVLVWNVYRHHELMHEPDESAVVRLDETSRRPVVIFASAVL